MAARPPLEARHSWHLGDMLDLNKAANQHPEEEKQDQDWDALAKALADRAKDWLPKYFPNGKIQGNELRLGSIDGRAPTGQGSVKIDFKGPHAGSWKDFAGGPGGGPNSTLMHATGLRGVDLYAEGCKIVGYDPATRTPRKTNGNGHSGGHTAPRRTTAERNQALASFEWEGAHRSLAGTPAEAYLNARGLLDPESESLRYAASCAHPDTRTGMPCIIARWRSPVTGDPLGGIHRTYLRQDGSWHVGRDGLKAKMSLGPSDGIVMLGGPTAVGDLVVGEGLETTLAGAALYDHPLSACWYGGTGGMLRLAALFAGGSLPAALTGDIKRVLILKDHGEDGAKAAHALAEAIEKAGLEAWIATPNSDPAGKEDFADDIAAGRGRTQHVRCHTDVVQMSDKQTNLSLPTDRLGKLIEDFNNQYAVVNESGIAVVYEQSYDPIRQRKILVRISFSDLKKFYQNIMVTVQVAGGKSVTKSAADWWLNSPRRKQYLGGVIFDPTDKSDNKKYWNLWSGFSVEPKQGDWSIMREHILKVVCSGNQEYYEYLIRWIARMFQHPNKPGEVAIVLRGEKGSGKGTIANWLVRAWGQHGIHIHSAKHLVGNFNGHLRDAVLLFADEAFFAGDRQHESVLKGLITEPTLPIEGKYQNLVEIPNMLHVIMASNSDWVIPASQRERRYFALNVPDSRVGNRKYFAALHDQMENGGLAAMIYDMLNYDISDFEVRDFPETDALEDQKKHSLDTLDRWLIEILERGNVYKSRFGASEFKQWMPWVSTELLSKSYLQWCAANRAQRPMSRLSLGKRLSSMYEKTRGHDNEIVGEVDSLAPGADPVMRQNRPHGYRLDDLPEAVDAFERARGVKIDAA